MPMMAVSGRALVDRDVRP